MVVMVVIAPAFPLIGGVGGVGGGPCNGGGQSIPRLATCYSSLIPNQYSTHFRRRVEHLSGQMFRFLSALI
jgi:hypothetical protein